MTQMPRLKSVDLVFKAIGTTSSQMMAFYLNCPVSAKVFGSLISRLKPSIIYSTDFTHLYYLPSTVTAATDDDKSLAISSEK